MAHPPVRPNPGINYDVAFSAIRIRKILSVSRVGISNDTLYIKMSVAVDGVDKGTVDWDGTYCNLVKNQDRERARHTGRDFNEGYYDGFRNNNGRDLVGVATGPVTDDAKVKTTFLVLNSGHDPNDAAYRSALEALKKAGQEHPGVWGTILTVISAVADALLGPNCDGPVAGDSFTMTGREIRDAIAKESKNHPTNPYYNWPRDYKGQNHPNGCNESDYEATIQFTVHH